MVIVGLKVSGSAADYTSNMKWLVNLLVLDLVHEVLNSGIKITRVLFAVGLKGQLGLDKGQVGDSIEEMPDASTRVMGGIINFLCQGQHRLVCLLVAST